MHIVLMTQSALLGLAEQLHESHHPQRCREIIFVGFYSTQLKIWRCNFAPGDNAATSIICAIVLAHHISGLHSTFLFYRRRFT